MARRAPAAQDTKERLLKAALDVFSEQGYQATTVDEIAARAGMTKGAIYYWFHDKADLAVDLHRSLWATIAAEAQTDFDPLASSLVNLKRSFRAYVTSLGQHSHARFFLRDTWAVPTLGPAGREQHELGATMLRQLIEQGIARGEIVPVDPEALTRILLGAYAEATLHLLSSGNPEDAIDVIERVIDAFATGK